MKRRFFIILVAALLLCPALAWAQTSCSAASSGTAPTGVTNGQFTTQNGQIIGPNGRPFVPRGVDVLWGDNPSLAQIEALAPGTNMIRLAVYQPFPSAASMASYVNSLTAAGIVVEIGDYSSSLGTNEGGGKDYIFNGQMLANEQAFYTDLGNTFKYNPYVWTGTDNEPSDVVQATNQASMSALGDWQQQTIDTIRATGDTAPILVDPWGGGDPASPTSGIALSATQAAADSNIIWDPHGYGWVATGYSQNQATVNQAIASLIAGARSVKTADGTAAAMIGEYGNAT